MDDDEMLQDVRHLIPRGTCGMGGKIEKGQHIGTEEQICTRLIWVTPKRFSLYITYKTIELLFSKGENPL